MEALAKVEPRLVPKILSEKPIIEPFPTHFLFTDDNQQFSELKSSIESEIRAEMVKKIKPSLFSTGSNLAEVRESQFEEDENNEGEIE